MRFIYLFIFSFFLSGVRGALLFLHVKVEGQLVREVHSLLPSCGFQEWHSGLQLESKCLYSLSCLAGPLPRNLTEELESNVSFLIICVPNKPKLPCAFLSNLSSYFGFPDSSRSVYPSIFSLMFPCVPSVARDHLEKDHTGNLSRLGVWIEYKENL